MHGTIDGGIATTVAESGNNLLRALRPTDSAILSPLLHPWTGQRGEILYQPGDTVTDVYFPCGPAMISYLVVLPDGRTAETALVGREGAVGGIVSHGRLPAFARAEVQFPGPFLRMSITDLEDAKQRSNTLEYLFARYADCMMAQVFQAVACNAAHTIEQRTAKWLLAAMERTGAPMIPLTQEQLAAMLGVGRSYISRVIASFKRRGILATRRGSLAVTDLDQLKNLACGCNECVRHHFEEVLSGVYPCEDELLVA
ncbi:MAG TPA: Crp/Fnr family transcriptional regulator [Sphingomicrobium sp.]|nr:Crp/Fnr family transcriptional regulator [Sphingomicrobium sp.]